MWETAKHQRVRPTVKTHSLKISHGWIMAAQTSKHGFSLSFFFILTGRVRSETVSVEQTLWNKLHNDSVCNNLVLDVIQSNSLFLVWMSDIRELMID